MDDEGIILWELLTSLEPFSQFTFNWQIAKAVIDGKRPPLPPFPSFSSPSSVVSSSLPPSSPSSSDSSSLSRLSFSAYVKVMTECWASVAAERPSFSVVLFHLNALSHMGDGL